MKKLKKEKIEVISFEKNKNKNLKEKLNNLSLQKFKDKLDNVNKNIKPTLQKVANKTKGASLKVKDGIVKTKDKATNKIKENNKKRKENKEKKVVTKENKVKNNKTNKANTINKDRKNNNKPKNKINAKEKRKKKNKEEKTHPILKFILKFFLTIFFLFLLFLLGCTAYIVHESPEFDPDNLQRNNGTLVYDRNNNLITVLGNEKRQKVTYDELPEVLVDAIIATEDSKFFQHNGVDIPRFLKATFAFLTGDDAGGASTITMQLSKNSFTSVESTGIKGIIRKLTDVYLSVFHIEREYTKEELLEFYVNSPYMGGSSYGVQQASKTYFNKNVSDLSLVEAATLAGLFQSPSAYDPYQHPDKIEERKNQVLSLMKRHGYITNEEYEIACSIKVKDILNDGSKKSTTEYQGFVDTVVQEVIDTTGNNPYEVPMAIYTTLDTGKQDIINNFYETHEFKDDKVEAGIGVIDNKTGEILAVGAGRNKSREMTFNYATQINRHPGSTAKPLFDYAPGIEYEQWSTFKTFYDKPTSYTNGPVIKNWDNQYKGYMTLKECLAQSRNTCALQAFQELDSKKIREFVETLGIKPEVNSDGSIGEWHSIGAFTGVNPVQLAGAYAAFGNEGYYTTPHSYTKIVYFNTGKEYKPEYEKVKAMSEETAYMISFILQEVTSSRVYVEGTEIATKTGTSSYDEELTDALGISSDVIQDSWTVTYSPDYTIAIWYGYDELTVDNYITMSHSNIERVNIQSEIVNKIMKTNSKFTKPDDVIIKYIGGAQHCYIKGTNPYSSYTPNANVDTTTPKKETTESTKPKEEEEIIEEKPEEPSTDNPPVTPPTTGGDEGEGEESEGGNPGTGETTAP